MSIKLAITGRPTIALTDESIMLGSDPSCAVIFSESSGVQPKHAVIRKIAGRWLIEVRDGESILCSNGEPKRLLWLNSGDVIRLTANGPEIIFKTSDDSKASDDLKPQNNSKAPGDDLLPMPAASALPSDVILPPDSSPSLPVRKSVSSASIRIPQPPSSTTIKTPKAPSSTTIKTPKPPSSGTIKSPLSGTIRTKPPSSTTIRSVGSSEGAKPSSKLNRSSADIPVPGAPLKRKSSQFQIPTSGDDEVANNVPTLQRLSSWDEEDPTQRTGLTAEQAEIRWIITIVGRSVGAGLAVILLYVGISSAWKAMQPTELSSAPPVTQSSSPSPQSPAQVTSFNAESSSPKVVTPAAPSDQNKKRIGSEKSSTAAAENESKDPKNNDSNRTSTAAANPNRQPDKKKPGSDDKKPAVDDSVSEGGAESVAATPVIRAVKDGIYAVVVDDPDKSKQIQLGTAWAASSRYLVTSATVVAAIEEHRQEGLVASIIQISTGKSLKIKTTRLHEAYRKASESAEEARELRDASRLATERANQVRFDLGILDVGRNERLPKKIASFAEPLDESKESTFVVVGLPFQQKDETDSPEFNESLLKERRCKKPSTGTAPQNKEMELMIQFGPDANGRNWSGCPVLNKDQKVIGVYSFLPSTGAIGNKPVKTESGVAWIGRLHEFAPELE